MGDRICLQFAQERKWGDETHKEISPVLYAHWDGTDLLNKAKRFWEKYHGEIRAEPSNFMVNFITYLRQNVIEDGGHYLYAEDPGCADDNGTWEMDTDTGEIVKITKGDWDSSGYEEGDIY